MFLNLKVGVSRLNLISFLILTFINNIVLYIKISITPYLLVTDYGITQHDSGKVAGRIGLFCAIATIPFNFIFGTLMDISGRKFLVIIGLVLTGGAFILMTFFD